MKHDATRRSRLLQALWTRRYVPALQAIEYNATSVSDSMARGLRHLISEFHISRRRSLMRTVLGIALALLLGLGATGAWAEDISGKVQSVDPSERMFVLDDGSKIWVAEGVSMDAVKEGSTVKASYEERDGKKVATSLEVSD